MHVDSTGKVSLDHIYTEPTPLTYFSTLRRLEYRIPQAAKPHFEGLVEDYRRATGVAVPRILDIGCSYGINAALVKYDATMDELYERYCDGPQSHEAVLARDREFVGSRTPRAVRFVGLDVSRPALDYALAAGFLDDAVHADFEEADPTDRQRAKLADTDLVVSTGCLGYVGEKSISRLIDAFGDRRPWMAHFVLRMFPFDPIEEVLTDAGYETVRAEGLFRQRRFATDEERTLVLDRLATIGLSPRGREADGWFHARLFISRPREETRPTPIEEK
ncbi:class I SAM-dependent methyltransferase [Actinocorallia populi]|uniref:class I SAM-dependent methyltransferase n=1 Tax=Actinocorallia populi TaxID=2079200 RepID=UPI000D08BAB9|nr:class I SAM-dependent methyltransferase [Actinocorallia populi]